MKKSNPSKKKVKPSNIELAIINLAILIDLMPGNRYMAHKETLDILGYEVPSKRKTK